jgi:DUF1365 family protein
MVKRIALYRTHIRHRRSHPIGHSFSYRGYWSLIEPEPAIAAEIRDFLAENDCSTSDITITMLTSPPQLGYSFNPITMFYCTRSDGAPAPHIAEVHNTYGGRHRYLLKPDIHDWCEVTKQLYVSPFYDVSGSYHIHCPIPDDRLSLTVQLNRTGEPPFVASVSGERVPITALRIAASTVLGSPLLTTARIRFQGIRLWFKRLKVQPRQQPIGAGRD